MKPRRQRIQLHGDLALPDRFVMPHERRNQEAIIYMRIDAAGVKLQCVLELVLNTAIASSDSMRLIAGIVSSS